MNFNSLYYCFFALILIGCKESYVEKKLTDKPFIANSSSTFRGYYYKGSDKNFDYFESKWDFTKNSFFKIKAGEFLIKNKLPINNNGEIEIDVIKTPNIFAISKLDTLYIPKKL